MHASTICQVIRFLSHSYHMLRAKKQRRAKREATETNPGADAASSSFDDRQLVSRGSRGIKEGSLSTASMPSVPVVTTTDGKASMMMGLTTLEEALEHEQLLIKLVQGKC